MGKTIRIVTHNLNGRTVGQIVEMTALDGAATLQEAIDMGFVQGKKELLMGEISGVMKADIKVALRARMLKEFKVDPSNFTIVVEGSTGTFAIQSITTGETLGVIRLGEDVLMNGNAPAPELVAYSEGHAPGEFTGLGTTVLEGGGVADS